MFAILELLHLVYVTASAVVGTSMYPVAVYPHPTTIEATAPIQMVREGYRKDGRGECVFNGAMVPYVQDQDTYEEVGDERRFIPADPDRIVGMALILHTKVCGEEQTEVARLGSQDAIHAGMLTEGLRNMRELSGKEAKDLPDWLPQVHERLRRLANHDENARLALAAVDRGAANVPEGAVVQVAPRFDIDAGLQYRLSESLAVADASVTWGPKVPIVLP